MTSPRRDERLGDRTGLTAGAVLTGGASSRMGTNKALADVGGEPMAARVAAVVREAGCAPIWFQGGDVEELAPLAGVGEVVPDEHPGYGPVGAIATILRRTPQRSHHARGALVVACDLIDVDVETVRSVIGAGNAHTISVATDRSDQPRRHLLSWWPVGLVSTVAAALDSGVASYQHLLDSVEGRAVEFGGVRDVVSVAEVAVSPASVRNANRPEDLSPNAWRRP